MADGTVLMGETCAAALLPELEDTRIDCEFVFGLWLCSRIFKFTGYSTKDMEVFETLLQKFRVSDLLGRVG